MGEMRACQTWRTGMSTDQTLISRANFACVYICSGRFNTMALNFLGDPGYLPYTADEAELYAVVVLRGRLWVAEVEGLPEQRVSRSQPVDTPWAVPGYSVSTVLNSAHILTPRCRNT